MPGDGSSAGLLLLPCDRSNVGVATYSSCGDAVNISCASSTFLQGI